MKSPRDLGLPYDTWRPGQQLAIRTAFHAKTDHTIIQSPTGSGKTAIAGALAQLDPRRTILLTASRGLQDQYGQELDFLTDIRGMGNYECLAARDEFADWFKLRHGRIMCDEGPCRSGAQCPLKVDGCLYFDQARTAMAARAVVTNYPYFLSMRRYAQGLGVANRIICDEAHSLPDELMGAYQIEIPFHALREAPLPYPPKAGRRAVAVALEWWKRSATRAADDLKAKSTDEDTRRRRHELVERLQHLADTLDPTWAWDVDHGRRVVTFEPTVPRLLMPMLYTKGIHTRLTYLSATITPALLTMLDIPLSQITFRVMQSRFPVERRPIYIVDAGRVDHRMREEGETYWLSMIDKFLKRRQDRKGIILPVSYARQYSIVHGSRYRGQMLWPRSSSELPRALERFRRATPPATLISPAIATGYNFPYTDAEYIVIAKMPFPDTRSPIAKARIRHTPAYRDHLTAQALAQGAGRGMRFEDDSCEVVIMDSHARWFVPKFRGLFPESFLEAVQWPTRLPDPLPRLT